MIVLKEVGGLVFKAEVLKFLVSVQGPFIEGRAEYSRNLTERDGAEAAGLRAIDYTVLVIVLPKLVEIAREAGHA